MISVRAVSEAGRTTASLDLDDQIVAVGAVEHVVGEHEVHLALHAVRLADAPDSIDVFHRGVWSVKCGVFNH